MKKIVQIDVEELGKRNAIASRQAAGEQEVIPTECTAEPIQQTATRAIFFNGPFPKPDPKGERDESPYWAVYLGDQEAEPVAKVYEVHSFKRAQGLALAMATDRKLELVSDALPA